MIRSEDISENHSDLLKNFQCNDEPIVKNYLIEDALENHNTDLVRTRLYFNEEDSLIGFTSMYNDMMEIGKDKRRKHRLLHLPSLKYYPAIKLHYIAVDERFRGRRYGEELLISVLSQAKNISKVSGCIFLNLESLPKAVTFYETYEFQRLSHNGEYMNMFFKLSEL
jgi:GNAT superfamily N-acetyltransferase